MAKSSYTKRDLTVACSNVKRDLFNKLKKGNIKSVTKTLAINELAKRLGLKSARTLWKPEYQHRKYLDDWCNSLEEQANALELSPREESASFADTSSSKKEMTPRAYAPSDSSSIPDLNKKIKEQNKTIDELKSIIRTLRIENESLRTAKLYRLSRLDNAEVLDESIDELELENLYKVITSLYNSRNL